MKDGTKRLILIGSFALLLAAVAVVLSLRVRAVPPKLSLNEPRTVVTPEPKAEEDAVKVRTPAPTPTPVIKTPVPVYPQKAVNLLVNGTPLFALNSRELAEQLVKTYLDECAAENLSENTILLTAAIDAELSTLPADGSVEILEFDVALNKLRKNRSLIPVRRTVERVTVRSETPKAQTEFTKLLPSGSRMFRRYGVAARTLVFSELLYKDGLAVSEIETLNTPVQNGIARQTLVGTYQPAPAADPSIADPLEGQPGPVPASLAFIAPLRGTITGYFGLATGKMRYGIDYTAAPGTKIVAPESGTVIFLGYRPGYGHVIEIRHDSGFVSRLSTDAHAAVPETELEKHVNKGDVIGTLPQIETAAVSVLHYELLIDGIPYNPLFYLPH